MKRILENQRFICLILLFSLLCLAGTTYAAGGSSSVKIDKAVYKPAKSSDSVPGVTCDVQNSGDQNTNVSLSFNSAKRGGKLATLTLNFILTNSEYSNLKSGDVINFQHGDSFSFISEIPKVFLTFSEGNGKKTKSEIDSISKGSPLDSDSTYMVSGNVEVINKRADGCLDVKLDATVQNAPISMITVKLDPDKNCIKSTDSKKIKSVPSTTIAGSFYPEKFTPSSSNGTSMLCNLPSIPGGLGSSSGSTGTPGTSESSSGSTGIPGFPDIPNIFGSSSGIFNFPGIPDGEN